MVPTMAAQGSGRASGSGTARKGSKKPVKKAVPEKPTLAEIGREASHEAQRKALLAELKANDWNLTATSQELGLSNGSNVIRSIRTLGLEDEYEAAKAAGKIPKGPRS